MAEAVIPHPGLPCRHTKTQQTGRWRPAHGPRPPLPGEEGMHGR